MTEADGDREKQAEAQDDRADDLLFAGEFIPVADGLPHVFLGERANREAGAAGAPLFPLTDER